jgi:predicted small lipoprotein YifL
MVKRLAALLVGLSLAAGAACGRKGPLALPPGQAPMPVEGLTAAIQNGAVVLAWMNPEKTVAGKPLGPLGAVEIWLFAGGPPASTAPLTPEAVERTARLVGRLEARDAAAASYVFAPGPDGPKSLAFTVRVLDRKGRASEFATPVGVAIDRLAAEGRA